MTSAITRNLADASLPQTARLQLTRLTSADAERVQTMTNDPAITGSIHFLPYPFELSDARDLIARNGEREAFLGILERKSTALAGVMGVHLQDADKIEIGYWIGSSYQGNGYAAEAAMANIAMLRDMFPERMIVAECRRENQASWKTLQKLGFRANGEMGKRPGRESLAL